MYSAVVTIGIERTEYSLSEGTTINICVVLTGRFDSSPSITVTLATIPGNATGKGNTILGYIACHKLNSQALHLPLLVFIAEDDFSNVTTSLIFSQQRATVQCLPVALYNDSNPNEGTETFTVVLATQSLLDNVQLDPPSATVSISDSVTSIVSDTIVKVETVEQTGNNLQLIGGVIEDITSSATNGDIVLDIEVQSLM